MENEVANVLTMISAVIPYHFSIRHILIKILIEHDPPIKHDYIRRSYEEIRHVNILKDHLFHDL